MYGAINQAESEDNGRVRWVDVWTIIKVGAVLSAIIYWFSGVEVRLARLETKIDVAIQKLDAHATSDAKDRKTRAMMHRGATPSCSSCGPMHSQP